MKFYVINLNYLLANLFPFSKNVFPLIYCIITTLDFEIWNIYIHCKVFYVEDCDEALMMANCCYLKAFLHILKVFISSWKGICEFDTFSLYLYYFCYSANRLSNK